MKLNLALCCNFFVDLTPCMDECICAHAWSRAGSGAFARLEKLHGRADLVICERSHPLPSALFLPTSATRSYVCPSALAMSLRSQTQVSFHQHNICHLTKTATKAQKGTSLLSPSVPQKTTDMDHLKQASGSLFWDPCSVTR